MGLMKRIEEANAKTQLVTTQPREKLSPWAERQAEAKRQADAGLIGRYAVKDMLPK